jgi:predicted Zn-dependent protease
MRTRTCTLLALLALAALVTGCKNLQETMKTAADIVQQNPQLIKDEEQRQKVLAAAKTVTAFTTDIGVPEEVSMGQALAARSFVSFGRPYQDNALQNYVTTVGRLVALQSERPTLPYSFAVVDSDTPNALALPGGYIFVSTGLLKMLKSESELACILAHEVCHVAHKDGVDVVARDRKMSSLVDFGTALDKQVGKYRQFIDLAYTKLTTEGYDQRYETIADEAGTRYAYRAGYYPGGLLPFLEAERASSQSLAFEVFKTHPDPGARIKDINAVLATLGDYSGMPKLADRYQKEVLNKLR